MCQMVHDPASVDSPPIANHIAADIVRRSGMALEFADDVQFGQGVDGVLGGAPGHAGGFGQCGHAGGDACIDQVGHVEAAIETGLGLAELAGHDAFPDEA